MQNVVVVTCLWSGHNTEGVDSVQQQGIVGCRAGIVGVDGHRDGCMALEGMLEDSIENCCVYMYAKIDTVCQIYI